MRDSVDESARQTPARFAIGIFTGLILALTLLLALPISSSTGTFTPLPQALFTATSSISVTGLAVVDMASHWSIFGKIMIILGIQIGGIGVLTLASAMGLVVTRRLGLKQRLMAASDTNTARIHQGPVSESQTVRLGDVTGMLKTVAISSLLIELALSVALLPRLLMADRDLWTAMWESAWVGISAFTNTGFLPFSTGMAEFATDPWFLSVISIGVFLGALGFPVIFALIKGWHNPHHWSVHVKLTLLVTTLLIAVGALFYCIVEWSNPTTLGITSPAERPLLATTFSIMTRSGGFAPFDVSELHASSLFFTDILMFIGGGSASTAGGIKVTTLAVLFLAARAEARGVDEIEVFDRRIPGDVLRLAVSVLLWSAATVAVTCLALMFVVNAPLDFILFDAISAFATSGLTSGLTASLPDAGVIILSITMWAGRVGTVTLAAALAARQHKQLYRRPEERPIVG